jgi:hypothetical protein
MSYCLKRLVYKMYLKLQHLIRSLRDVTLSVYPHRAGLKNMPGHGEKYAWPPWPGIFFKPARCGYTLRVTSRKHLIHLSTLHQHSKS